jgi:hypothetical protein
MVVRFGTPAADVVPIGAPPGPWFGADEMAMLQRVNATRARGLRTSACPGFSARAAPTWHAALARAAARHPFDIAQ